MLPLFEVVTVNPKLIWSTQGQILRYLKLRYGFLLLTEKSNGIIKQIEHYLDNENLRNDKTADQLKLIGESLAKIENEGLIIEMDNSDQNSDNDEYPSHIQLADKFSESLNKNCLCLTFTATAPSEKEKSKSSKTVIISLRNFASYEIFGKTSNVLQNSDNTAKMLRELLFYSRFNSQSVGSLNIVDHFVYKVHKYYPSEKNNPSEKKDLDGFSKSKKYDTEALNYLETIEETCFSLVKIYREYTSEKNLIPLRLNIFFRADCTRDDFVTSFEKYVTQSISFFSNVKNQLKLTFHSLKPNNKNPVEHRPPPVKNRYIFSKNFLIQTDIGLLSKPGGGHNDKFNEWTLIPKEVNDRRPKEITLETVYKNFTNFSDQKSPYYREFEYSPNFEEIWEKHKAKLAEYV